LHSSEEKCGSDLFTHTVEYLPYLDRPTKEPNMTENGVGDEVVISIKRLVKRYGEFTAVSGIDLDVFRGEIFGFLGPNGAGKTTTIECIVGLRVPTEGTVSVLGLNPSRDRAAFTAKVAVQPQSASIFENLTVHETLRLFASFHTNPRSVEETIAKVGLMEQGGVRAGKLSGGQTRRLLLGVALVGDPEIVVLDEPSAGLDPIARQSLWSVIRDLRDMGTTVLLSTHHMDEATELCDRVAILVGGSFAATGTPGELIRERSSMSSVSFTIPNLAQLAAVRELLPDELSTGAANDGVRVSVKSQDPDMILRRLTFATGIDAKDFSVQKGSLEDVFVELAENTQHSETGRPAKPLKKASHS
jgi:ABC-2 type transport system ATP-binding protein